MAVVVDASVLAKWVLWEDHALQARRVVDSREELVAPDLVGSELANVLWKRHRRGECDAAQCFALLSELLTIPMRTEVILSHTREIIGYAMLLGHSAYDCAYLVVAEAEGCRDVTADRRFHRVVGGTAFADRVQWIGDVG